MTPRPMYWSIRRELWENRSLYIAPLIAIAIALLAFLFSTIRLPQQMRTLDPSQKQQLVSMPYSAVAGLTILIGFIVGAYYCIDALHGERRDRSILFWKSLPVSDRTTVLAKASIPLVVQPLIGFGIIVAAQLFMLIWSSMVLTVSGVGAAALWSQLPLGQMTIALVYALIAIALWHALIYAWLLLISAWARRAVILWAILPLVAIQIFERIAFGTTHVQQWIRYRMLGWYTQAFVQTNLPTDRDPLTLLTPAKFLTTPGLWVGLLFAAAFIATAIELRRNREPI